MRTGAGLEDLAEFVRGWLDELKVRDKKTRRGAEQIVRLARAAQTETDEAVRARMRQLIFEVASALENNRRAPVPRTVDVAQLPFVHRRYAGAAIGKGDSPARNLEPRAGVSDTDALDPLPSTFWQRPKNIAAANLATGFNRGAAPQFQDGVWTYSGPKTSYGGHAGFEAECDGQKIKVKFGEVHSEPFAARIFHALGYNVDPTDCASGLKVRYDRRLFTEFNSRKPLDTRITALCVLPVWTIHFQPVHDPFRFIAAVVMKDGTKWTGEQFRSALLDGGAFAHRKPASRDRAAHRREGSWSRARPVTMAFTINEEVEAQVDHLVTVPANVQIKDKRVQSIGPWDFGQLGHEHLREVRGAGLLAAWLGWFDSRFDNTRLKIVQSGGGTEIKHYFADLGGCLGKSSGWFSWRDEDADAFPSFFTRPEIRNGPGRMAIPFQIVNHRPVESTAAFREMTVDDARWMARLIAQLTREQLLDALTAAGFDDEKRELYAEKLIARRDRMVLDLELGGELRLLADH